MTDEVFEKRFGIYKDCGNIYKLLTHIPEVSFYNHNYYIGPEKGELKNDHDLIYVECDDDNLEEFFVIQGDCEPVFIGYMFSDEGVFYLSNTRLT